MKENTFSQSDPLVSVVIRNRNEAFYLERVFTALHSQDVPFTYEIILVDNESEDNSCEVGAANGVRLVPLPRNEFTYGRALNIGIAHARGEFILLLSAHALPIGSNFLQNCITPFGDPQVAAARCLSTSDTQNLMQWYQPRVIHYATADEQKQAETGQAWLRTYPAAACCVLRKSVWEEIKFDETLDANEDKEWASRVLARGHKVVNSAECIFHYMKPFDEVTLWKKQQRELLALYRIKGQVPLTWKWFFIRMVQALYHAPGVAFQHVRHKFLKNYYLVTIPAKAKLNPGMESSKELEQK